MQHMSDTTATAAPASERSAIPREVRRAAPGLREVAGIWILSGVLTLAVLVTYARFPVDEFYNVSNEGLAGGLSRALVLLNFPVAFIAIALMGFALARLYSIPDALSTSGRWAVGIVAAVATAMALVAAFVVDQGDLDAKPANAIPALGVALALGITLFAARRTGFGEREAWTAIDTLRLVSIALLAFFALPWIFADLGVFVAAIPLIGRLFMSDEVLVGHTLKAVHLGHHHGLDGVIFAISAIVLTRQLPRVTRALRWPLTGYVALMLVYGLANTLQDFWGEQIVKRGWAETGVPTVLQPKLTPAWGVIVVMTVIVTVLLLVTTRSLDEERSVTPLY